MPSRHKLWVRRSGDIARMNEIANDLGVDSIELGATIAVLMDVVGGFGDVSFMKEVTSEMMAEVKLANSMLVGLQELVKT